MKAANSGNRALHAKLTSNLELAALSLFLIKHAIFLFVQRTHFTDRMASMTAMLLLTGVLLGVLKKTKIKLSVFPASFTVPYIGVTILLAVLLIANPSNNLNEIGSVLMLIYACLVTPVFEELLFRGYIWNKLSMMFGSKWKTYLLTTILFGLWHLAYMDSIAFRVEDGLLTVMVWKVMTGLCFGIILGAVRMKTQNCYAAILLHGAMNLFGR